MQILMGIEKCIHPRNNRFSQELEPITPESYPGTFAVNNCPLITYESVSHSIVSDSLQPQWL